MPVLIGAFLREFHQSRKLLMIVAYIVLGPFSHYLLKFQIACKVIRSFLCRENIDPLFPPFAPGGPGSQPDVLQNVWTKSSLAFFDCLNRTNRHINHLSE